MVGNILNPLDDSRSVPYKMQQPSNSRETAETRNTEYYKVPTDDTYSHCPERMQSDKIETENTSTDKDIKKTDHPEKRGIWNINHESRSNEVDSNIAPLSPLSKALAMASVTPVSDIADDYFDSMSQEFNTYNLSRSRKEERYGEGVPNINNEIKQSSSPASNYIEDRSLQLKNESSAKDSAIGADAIQNGVNSKAGNNLAGIVISSGPGGHFETFEGNECSKQVPNYHSKSSLHVKNTIIPLLLQGDDLTLSLLEQQFQDNDVVSNIGDSDFLCYTNLFNSYNMVSDLPSNNSKSLSNFKSGHNQNVNGNLTTEVYSDIFTELIYPYNQSTESNCYPNEEAQKPSSGNSFLVSSNVKTHTELNPTCLKLPNTNTAKFNTDELSAPCNKNSLQFHPKPPFMAPYTMIAKENNFPALNVNTITTQSKNDNACITTDNDDTIVLATTKIQPRKKHSLRVNANSKGKKSTKPIFQKSLLKSKNTLNIYNTGCDSLYPKTQNGNVDPSLITDHIKQPIISQMSLVSTTSSNVAFGAALDHDIPGKFISLEEFSNNFSMDFHFEFKKLSRDQCPAMPLAAISNTKVCFVTPSIK